VERVLIVNDSLQLLRSVRAALAETYPDVRACGSVSEVEAAVAEGGRISFCSTTCCPLATRTG
jgi:hypothetical protein